MDEIVKRSIAIVAAKQKTSVPWKPDEPFPQTIWRFTQGKWQAESPPSTTGTLNATVHTIALFSWNIDFMLPFPDSRMRAGLRHLQQQLERGSADRNIIFLNECLESDLKVIAADAWVRETFALTDVDTTQWQSGHYGTTTLVDRRLPVTSCFRVHYSQTRMERDGLFVDVDVGLAKPLRFCNTHAESLALEPPYRPAQIQRCAVYMHDTAAVSGAVLAGDLNAIQDFDKHLHNDNGLKDAYLEMGGREEDVAGHTWGQQAAPAQRERFGTSRMDKVFYCGAGVTCERFDLFGRDIEVEDAAEKQHLLALSFDKPWITDHLGVHAVFRVISQELGVQ